METPFPKLFSPIRVGSIEIPNRIVFPPIGTRLMEEGGVAGPTLINYYARRAEGGAGLVIVELATVDERHFTFANQLRLGDDRFLPGLRDLASAVKRHGSRVAVQLYHPGRQAQSSKTGRPPIAPSPIPPLPDGEVPLEMTLAEIEEVIELFGAAALRAREAGFDAVQLHGAHGYLICQFLSPRSNIRTDAYGGDTARRARFAIDVIRRCKELAGNDFPVMLRISAEEYLPGGLTLAETPQIARLAVAAGADAIDVSAGSVAGSLHWTIMPHFRPRGTIVPLAAAIKQAVSVPVVAVGRINDAPLAESVLASGQADLIAIGRALIADPDLPRKALAHGRLRRCIACSCCAGRPQGPLRCIINPEVGREGIGETRAAVSHKVIVVGAGPSGLEAARVARLRGHEVALWEARAKPGGRWTYLIGGMIKERLQGLRELGVSISFGLEATLEMLLAAQPEVVLVTPTLVPRREPFSAPGFAPSAGLAVLTADDLLDCGAAAGERVAVLGSASAGCEAAQALLRGGAKVTMVDFSGKLAEGVEPLHRKTLIEKMTGDGLEIIHRARSVRPSDGELVVSGQEGDDMALPIDTVVLALGYDQDDSLLARLRQAHIDARPLPAAEVPQSTIPDLEKGGAVAREI